MTVRHPTRPVHAPIVLAVVLALILAACGESRPTPERWIRSWERISPITAGIEAPDALDDRTECETLLVRSREARGVLLPTPDSTLDGTVEAWIAAAEALGFGCPRVHGDEAAQGELVRKIRSLEAQVAAGLVALAPDRAEGAGQTSQ